jgi:phosphohistidine phosphatase
MRLMLIRHADAGQRDETRWPDDTQRPLTGEGRKVQTKMCRRLRKRGLVPDLLLSSPWVRAWETAAITAEVLCKGAVAPVECPALAAPPDIEALAAAIGPQPPTTLVGLVGHEPWLSELASLLLAGSADAIAIDFPKSGVLGLQADRVAPPGATLQYLLRPRRAY